MRRWEEREENMGGDGRRERRGGRRWEEGEERREEMGGDGDGKRVGGKGRKQMERKKDMTCLKFACMDQVEYNLQCNCTIGRG